MRITLSQSAAADINAIVEPTIVEHVDPDYVFAAKTYERKNTSLKLVDGEYVLEINDEVFTRYAHIWVKCIEFIVPLIGTIDTLLNVLKKDIQEFTKFIEE